RSLPSKIILDQQDAGSGFGTSNPEIAVLQLRSATEFLGGAAPDDPAALDQVMVVGNPDQGFHVLVDDQDGLPGPLQAGQAVPDLGPDERCEAFGRLIED